MNDNTRLCSFRLSHRLYEKLQQAAFVLDVPASLLIRWAVRDYVDTILEGGHIDGSLERGQIGSRDHIDGLCDPEEDPGEAGE